MWRGHDSGANLGAVVVGQIQAVLLKQHGNLKFEVDIRLAKEFDNLRIADLELTQIVKIEFVDRAAGSEDL